MVIAALATGAVLFITAIYYSRPKSKMISVDNIHPQKEILKSRKIFTLAAEPVEQE